MRQLIEQDVRNAYQQPALNRLTLRQAIQSLLGRARDLLPFFHPEPRQAAHEEAPKKYSTPTLRKITPEQASLVLIGHASVGAQGAKDLMELVFPDPTVQRRGSVSGGAAGAYPSGVYGRCPAPDCP